LFPKFHFYPALTAGHLRQKFPLNFQKGKTFQKYQYLPNATAFGVRRTGLVMQYIIYLLCLPFHEIRLQRMDSQDIYTSGKSADAF
jgi:hypothetical protein